MPPAGPRAALLLLSLLLLLRAILTVPLERGAPKEENPATESPVSGVPCSPARCLQWYTTIPVPPWPLAGYGCGLESACHSLPSQGFDVVKNLGAGVCV